MLKKIIGVFALSLMLVACGDESVSEDVETTDVAVENERVTDENLNLEADKQAKVEAEAKAEAQEAMEQICLNILKDSYSETANVTLDVENKKFLMIPLDGGFTFDLMNTATGSANTEGWDSLVNSIVEVSEALQKNLGDGYSIAILNPSNTDRVFLLVSDGVVIYDVIHQ